MRRSQVIAVIAGIAGLVLAMGAAGGWWWWSRTRLDARMVEQHRGRLTVDEHHTCAARADGRARCWGSNDFGQLGVPVDDLNRTLKPASVPGVEDVVELRTGDRHTCARRRDGTITCWGFDKWGQLGVPPEPEPNTPMGRWPPTRVPGVAGAIGLGAGEMHTCALMGDRTVTCWGSNFYGQLGDGSPTSTNRHEPKRVPGLEGIETLVVQGRESCAIGKGGRVWCWGGGHHDSSPTPELVRGIDDAVAIAMSVGETCALRRGGSVRCWGLGFETEPRPDRERPQRVAGAPDLIAIAVGSDYACGIDEKKTVLCWGKSRYGELGDGANTSHAKPTRIPGLTDVEEIATASAHACARRTDDTVLCWGENDYKQLGHTSPGTCPAPESDHGSRTPIPCSLAPRTVE